MTTLTVVVVAVAGFVLGVLWGVIGKGAKYPRDRLTSHYTKG